MNLKLKLLMDVSYISGQLADWNHSSCDSNRLIRNRWMLTITDQKTLLDLWVRVYGDFATHKLSRASRASWKVHCVVREEFICNVRVLFGRSCRSSIFAPTSRKAKSINNRYPWTRTGCSSIMKAIQGELSPFIPRMQKTCRKTGPQDFDVCLPTRRRSCMCRLAARFCK